MLHMHVDPGGFVKGQKKSEGMVSDDNLRGWVSSLGWVHVLIRNITLPPNISQFSLNMMLVIKLTGNYLIREDKGGFSIITPFNLGDPPLPGECELSYHIASNHTIDL